MPIAPGTIEIGISLARVTIQAGQRLDRIFAENKVVTAPLAWPIAPKIQSPTKVQLKRALEDVVAGEEARRDAGELPQLAETQLEAIRNAITEQSFDRLRNLVHDFAPETITFDVQSGDAASVYLEALEESGHIKNMDTARQIVYFLAPGTDNRQQSTPWQVGTVLLAAVADLALSTQETLIKDARQKRIVAGILERLATLELLEASDGRRLLSQIVGATLNGVVDARVHVDPENPWLSGLLNALADARATQPTDRQGEYMLGLLRGDGYRQLVAEILEQGSEHLSANNQKAYQTALADFLKSATQIVEASASDSAKVFFEKHWPDLVRAGFGATHSHGPQLLEGTEPVLGIVLLTAFKELQDAPGREFLNSEMLEAIAEGSIATIAENPELIEGNWLRVIFRSYASVIAETGIREAFSNQALTRFTRELARRIARSPVLLASSSEAATELMRCILLSVSDLSQPTAELVAEAALLAALDTATAYPEVLLVTDGTPDTGYASAVAALSRELARIVKTHGLTALTAAGIASGSIRIIASSPRLFIRDNSGLAAEILNVVAQIAQDDPSKLITEAGLQTITNSVLRAMAIRGQSLLDASASKNEMISLLAEVIREGLKLADQELGHSVDISAIPKVIGRLVDSWLRGQLLAIDSTNASFVDQFRAIAAQIAPED
ncbi:hypothetical protein [Ruegeria jejuensis]|uniref:hypothetical protein n=1 Tax=Ruegeria jejuensis TaxID=3233338 RepID=UPI00355C2DF0